MGEGGRCTASACRSLLDQGADRLYATFHDSPHVQLLPLEMNRTCRNAGHFQQIIDQMYQLPNLTLNDRAGLLLTPALAPLKPKQLHSVQDGGKGIAEFVTEHRQKLVLAAVGFGQFAGPLSRGRNVIHGEQDQLRVFGIWRKWPSVE